MPGRRLRIAWIGAGPGDQGSGGVPGVATELLDGLAKLGHTIDCFRPGTAREVPAELAGNDNVTFVWGTGRWRWNRWYSQSGAGSWASGLLIRAVASLRLRREMAHRHRRDPYDVIYQFSSIEALSRSRSVGRAVPLVIHPEVHAFGELRCVIAERALSRRSQPSYIFILAVVLLWLRSVVQRFAIRRAGMVVCISSVFRDDLVRDYGLAREVCEVVPNPVRLARFTEVKKEPGRTPVLLVLGRIAVRKGIDDVVAVAGLLHDRNVDVRIRVVGGPTLYSDYRKLLEDLPDNAEYAGRVPPTQVAAELAQSDVLLQPSTYEPFGLTVGEALAAGVPVVASTVVGAIEGVDRRVAAAVEPGDAHGIAAAVEAMLEELRRSPQEVESTARGEAARLFAPETVCRQISDALAQLAPPAE